jgi:hypothetical protein
MPSPYQPAPGSDPLWDAYLAQYGQGTEAATRTAGQRKTSALSARDQALRDIEANAQSGRDQIMAAMLARGMYGSGETTERMSDYEAQLARQRSGAESGYSEQVGGIDAWLANELGRLMAERESQAATSQQRTHDREVEDFFRQQQLAALRAQAGAPIGGGGWYGQPTPPAPPRPPAPSYTPRQAPRPAPRQPTPPPPSWGVPQPVGRVSGYGGSRYTSGYRGPQ